MFLLAAGGIIFTHLTIPVRMGDSAETYLGSDSILASVTTSQVTFPFTMSPILLAHPFTMRKCSKQSGLPWTQSTLAFCSVLTAIGSPRSPKQIRGSLWEAPSEHP